MGTRHSHQILLQYVLSLFSIGNACHYYYTVITLIRDKRVDQSQFHVDLKSNFALKNNSMDGMESLLAIGWITQQVNVIHESRMNGYDITPS